MLVVGFLSAFGVYYLLEQAPKRSAGAEDGRGRITMVAVRDSTDVGAHQFTWRDIESPTYEAYVANLRRIGCPEATVEDIIVADVNAFFLSNAKPVVENYQAARRQFYTNSMQAGALDSLSRVSGATRVQLATLNVERLSVIKRLLQHDVEAHKVAVAPWEYLLKDGTFQFSYLPDHKVAEVWRLKEETQDRQRQCAPPGKAWTIEQAREIDGLHRDYERDLAALLTPEEFNQYLTHDSLELGRVRSKLSGIEVSDEELTKLILAERTLTQKHGFFEGSMKGAPSDSEAKDPRMQDIAALESEYEAVLGQERAAEIRRREDPIYQGLKSFAQEQGLTKEQAVELYKIQLDARNELSQIRAFGEAALDRDGREQILRGAGQRVINVIGADAYKTYTDGRAGAWLRSKDPVNAGRVFKSAPIIQFVK